MTNAEVLQQVERGYRMPSPPGNPEALYAIMLDCWKAVCFLQILSRNQSFDLVRISLHLISIYSFSLSVLTVSTSQNAEERPTFESLQWRLEDFFVNSEANYTEAGNVL